MATTKKLSRQKRALTMLENTLKSGVKTLRDGSTKEKLSDSDVKRINSEIMILKASITKG